MIIGIGNDLIDITRIQKALTRHGKRFEERCFTAHEQKKAQARANHGGDTAVYAKRFAAKEACAKALGTGFAEGVEMRDIGVIEDDKGRPFLSLTGGALKRLESITPDHLKAELHLSLTDEPPFAQAFVVIYAIPKDG